MGWLRCPYPSALVVFFAAMAICLFAGGQSVLGLPPASSAAATLSSAAIAETLRHRSQSCSWSQSGPFARLLGYAALFLVGVFVAWPAMTPTHSVGSVFRWGLPVAGVALLLITARHVYREHRE